MDEFTAMKVVGFLFVINCVVGAVYGGCEVGNTTELLTYDNELREPLKRPIQKVVRDLTTKRVECIEAYINLDDLGLGTSPNQKARIFAKKSGYPGDLPGQLVPKILGGTGYRTYNIVPYSDSSFQWRRIQRKIRNRVRDENVNATYIVEPQYDSNIHPTRPTKLKYSFTFTDGTGESGFVDNPKADDDEEEEEEEDDDEDDDDDDGSIL